MARNVQTVYQINPDVGFIGDISRPNEPFAMDSGYLHVPTSATRNPRPGDAVYWNETNVQFAVPTSAAQQLLVTGILHYRKDDVAGDADQVEFEDGDFVEVCIMGTLWVRAGNAVHYQRVIEWQTGDYKWNQQAPPTAVAGLYRNPIVSASRFVAADTDIIEARIGYGRVL